MKYLYVHLFKKNCYRELPYGEQMVESFTKRLLLKIWNKNVHKLNFLAHHMG